MQGGGARGCDQRQGGRSRESSDHAGAELTIHQDDEQRNFFRNVSLQRVNICCFLAVVS